MKTYKKLLIIFVTVALGAAYASDYKLDLTQPIQVGATQLKPGKYKIEIQGDKALFKAGNEVVAQVPVSVETVKLDYPDTALDIKDSQLLAISIGGTKTRIVLKP